MNKWLEEALEIMGDSTNAWFGKKPWAHICKFLPHVHTPVGHLCFHCYEAVGENDDGEIMPCGDTISPIHRECLLRSIMGSLGHQMETCPCHGGTEEDPPGMTKREAAIAAADYYDRHGKVAEPR